MIGRKCSRRSVLRGTGGVLAALAFPAAAGSADTAATVRIGHIQSLSGPSAPYGIRARDGAALAAMEINEAGGLRDDANRAYTIELLDGDMVNDPKQAITLFRQYALNPRVVATMGPTNSLGFVPCIPAAAQFELPLIGNGSGAPVSRWTPWAYRVNPDSSTATPILLHTVASNLTLRRLAVIYDQTQDGQAADAKIARAMSEEIGYELVAYEAFRSADQDFSPQLTKIRVGRPDAVFVAAATGDGVRIVTQLREMGIDVPLLTGYGAFFDPVYWNATKGRIRDCYTWLSQDPNHAAGATGKWLADYTRLFDLEPTAYSMHGYDTVYAIAECIRMANSLERQAIREVLSNLDFTSPIGSRIRFRNPPHGNSLSPSVAILKITGRATANTIS